MSVNQQTALVTGGGTGVGAAIALALAEAGVSVAITGRTQATLESSAARHANIDWAVCDMLDADAVNRLFEQSTGFDIVVANAGNAISKPFEKSSVDDLDAMLDVNVRSVFLTWQAALSSMKQKNHGRLIVTASTAGLKGYPYVSAYCTAKHAVVGLTRSLALELANTEITVNAICPGFVETPMLVASIDNIVSKTGRTREQAEASLKQSNPQRRFVQVDEIAQTVLWLCSDASRSVTGQAISISGGEI